AQFAEALAEPGEVSSTTGPGHNAVSPALGGLKGGERASERRPPGGQREPARVLEQERARIKAL
ncbi:hypothetical protein P7K49_028774, partial [Saguinus oedipus]